MDAQSYTLSTILILKKKIEVGNWILCVDCRPIRTEAVKIVGLSLSPDVVKRSILHYFMVPLIALS